ncbi:MAG: hypothetical protein GC206_17100 [Alphaproteobacteria bacterium]|nr:hypothetical protein [Alphaproteobacteria bacterium]
MTDTAQAAVRTIIEHALAELIAFGFDEQGAAGLLAVQGLIRIDDVDRRRDLLHLIDDEQFEDPAARGRPYDDALDGAE